MLEKVTYSRIRLYQGCETKAFVKLISAVGYIYALVFYVGHTILHIMIQSILSFTISSKHCDSKKLDIFWLLQAC